MASMTTSQSTIGPRGTVRDIPPSRPDEGASRMWRRTINGKHYSFNVVNMPNGDVRLFVNVYNGYADSDVEILGVSQEEADRRGMQWGCAWTRVHAIYLHEETPSDVGTMSYTVSAPGARTLAQARQMTFGAGRVVTGSARGRHASVFVGLTLHFDGTMPDGIEAGTPPFFAWVRSVAEAAEGRKCDQQSFYTGEVGKLPHLGAEVQEWHPITLAQRSAVDAGEAMTDMMASHGFRHGEMRGHIVDMVGGDVLLAEDWTAFRIVRRDMTDQEILLRAAL